MKFLDIASVLILILGVVLFVREIPRAIIKQVQIDETIRVARCERNYIAGYCDGLPRRVTVEARK